MNINRNYSGTTRFKQLKIGDVFTFDDRVYMVTNSDSGDTVVDLGNGEMTYIDGDVIVIPHPTATLNLNLE